MSHSTRYRLFYAGALAALGIMPIACTTSIVHVSPGPEDAGDSQADSADPILTVPDAAFPQSVGCKSSADCTGGDRCCQYLDPYPNDQVYCYQQPCSEGGRVPAPTADYLCSFPQLPNPDSWHACELPGWPYLIYSCQPMSCPAIIPGYPDEGWIVCTKDSDCPPPSEGAPYGYHCVDLHRRGGICLAYPVHGPPPPM